MQGGVGDDVYVVDNGADFVFEAAAAGTDTVVSSISTTLNIASRANVENLTLTGAAVAGVGNALSNTIVGTNGANSLQGLAGSDNLIGQAGNDVLLGQDGNDLLQGGLGADFLSSGNGFDTFRFNTAIGAGQIDTVADFNSVFDTMQLDDDIFVGVGPLGTLSAAAFRVGGAAADADDRIIYNNVTGALFFDSDGNGGAAQTQIATLTGSPDTVSRFDFVIIA